MKGPSIKWEDIGPKKAAAYLLKNVSNRRLKEESIRGYEADMRAGNWVPTHQGIAFNDRWELIDGQNRLTAIVRAGVTVRMLVTRGLPSVVGETHVMDAVDRGVTRSVADQLRLQHGFSNPNLGVAAVAAIGTLVLAGRVRKQTVSQVLKMLELYGRHIGEIGKLIDSPKTREFRRAHVCGALAFARAVEPHQTDRFLQSLLSGADLKAGSAILTIRNFLLGDAAREMIGGSIEQKAEMARLVLNALHAAIEQREWPRPVGGRAGYIYFAERQGKNLERVSGIYLAELGPLVPDKPGRKLRDYTVPPKPPRVLSEENYVPTPAAERLLRDKAMSERFKPSKRTERMRERIERGELEGELS